MGMSSILDRDRNRLARTLPIVGMDAHAVVEALTEVGIESATATSSVNDLDEANQ